MTNVHWRSKIKLTLKDFSRTPSVTIPQTAELVLSTVQSYDPQITTNADVNDSISSERIGYLIRPGRITITLTVLAARPQASGAREINDDHYGFSDSELLSILQFGRVYFNVEVSHDGVSHNDFGDTWIWENCIVTDSNPSQLTIDGRPTANFTLSALGMQNGEVSF